MEAKYGFEQKYRDQILRCSACGFCRAVCPLFGTTIRPALNARGKMLLLKEVMEGQIDFGEDLIETLFQCTTCGICARECPSGVDVPEIIKESRKNLVQIGFCHPALKGINDVLLSHANLYAEDQPADFNRKRNRKAEYVYFVGCVGLYREKEPTLATLDLLDRLKVDYTLIDEVCCSGVLEDVGYRIHEDLARQNVEGILATGARGVITGCPYCTRTITGSNPYAPLRERGVNVLHISQFLKDFDLGVKTERRVTYHDPCDLGRHCGIYEEPRQTIRKIAPNFVEMEHHHGLSLCCGAGGGVRAAFAKNSIAMARRRLEEAESIGAEVLLTDCNSCVHNLKNARLRRQKVEIYSIAQFATILMQKANKKGEQGVRAEIFL